MPPPYSYLKASTGFLFAALHDCRETVSARAPTNGGKNYPYSEAVLINCTLAGISPAGWGEIGGETMNIHYWEYNSTNISDGKPVDVSKRHPASRHLTMEKDAEIIKNYRNPAYVLDGWVPKMALLILKQPEGMSVKRGGSAALIVSPAAIPESDFQWYKNDTPVKGATNATLTLNKISTRDAAAYTVIIKNDSGTITSHKAILKVE
jgi:pectinesterase